ncbi:DUF4397 domain-containing protein [Paenibacillus sp. GCM10023252]|uniref:DUF4397 domain-containing protein n=1 Tax=Paenibacillus sp. GCM10023252 TaxID=3252649 RepID=UPI00361ACD1F
MTNEEVTLYLWKQASFYGLLADYYKCANPELHHYYGRKHVEALCRLAEQVARYGDPFDQQSPNANGPLVSPASGNGNPSFPNNVLGAQGGGKRPDEPSNSAGYSGYGGYDGYGYGTNGGYSAYGSANGYTPYGANPYNEPYYGGYEQQSPYIRTEQPSPNPAPPPNPNNMPPSTYASVRLLHASPDAPAVDVYANGTLIASNIKYKDSTPYLMIPAGSYSIEIKPAGSQTAVLTKTVSFKEGTAYTAAAAGKLANLTLNAYVDDVTPVQGQAKIRFIHLAPGAPNVDIKVKNGPTLYSDVAFGEAGAYLTVPPGSVDLQVFPTGSNKAVLTVPGVKLEPSTVYTIAAVGLAGGTPPLEALPLQDS